LDLLLEPAGIGRRLHRLDEKAGVETAQFRIFECSPYQCVLRRTVRDLVVPLKESKVLIPRQELMALSRAVTMQVEVVHARKADDAVRFSEEHVRRNETQHCGEIEAQPDGVAKAPRWRIVDRSKQLPYRVIEIEDRVVFPGSRFEKRTVEIQVVPEVLAVVRPQPSIFEEGAVSIAERALGEPTVHLFDHRVKSGILAVDKQRGERLTRSRNAKAPEERHGHAFPNHRLVEKHIVENECLQSQELTASAVMSEVDFQTRLDAAA